MELGRLRAAWRRSLDGERTAVLMSGEPGIGKTCIAIELGREVERNGGLVLYGRCDEDPILPYEPFTQVLQQLAARMSPAHRPLHPGGLASLVQILAPASDRPGTDPSAPDAAMRRLLLFEGARTALRASSSLGPLLLVLDDLQWADSDTLRLLRYLLRERWGTPALVLAIFRDTEPGTTAQPLRAAVADLHGDGTVEHMEIGPLSDTDVLTFARAHLGGDATVDVLDQVRDASGGNPFFLKEVLAAVPAGNAGPRPADLPVAARDMIAERLARLSPACRTLLDRASVLGTTAELGILRSLYGGDGPSLAAALDEAIRTGLLLEEETHYRFGHGLVRQAVLRGLPLSTRQELHLQTARALAAARSWSAGEGPLTIAAHYRKAGDSAPPGEALGMALAAADAALENDAVDEAVDWWDWSVALMDRIGADPGERAAVLDRMAGVLDIGREQVRATAYLRRALQLREQQGVAVAIATAQSRLGWAYASGNLRTTDVEAARACFQAAEPALREAAGHGLVALHGGRAVLGISSFRIDDLRHAVSACELGTELGMDGVAPLSRIALAMLSYHSGAIDDGLRLADEVREEARTHGDAITAAIAAFVGGIAWQRFGDPCPAIERLRPELEGWPAPATAAPWGIAPRLVSALVDSGDLAAAQAISREYTDRDQGRIEIVVERAALAFYNGDWNGGVWAEADDMATAAALRGDRCSCHNLRHWLLPALRVRGEPEHAAAIAAEDLASTLVVGSVAQEFIARAELALLLAEAGTGGEEEALAHLSRCREILPRAAERHGLEGKLLLAEALLAASDAGPDPATATLELAVDVFQRYSTPWLEARALEDWALVLGRARFRKRAASMRRRAQAVYEAIGAGQPWLDRLAAIGTGNIAHGACGDLPDGLTSREAVVLRLVARGQSNRQIAEELVLSIRTVERHIANIYDKAGVHTKSQATAYAFSHNLN